MLLNLVLAGASCDLDFLVAVRRPYIVLQLRMPWFGGGGGNRTRVRKSSAVRPTYLAWSFGSRLAPAGRQADAQPVASTDARGQATKPRTGADVNDAALRLRSLAHQQTSAASSRY